MSHHAGYHAAIASSSSSSANAVKSIRTSARSVPSALTLKYREVAPPIAQDGEEVKEKEELEIIVDADSDSDESDSDDEAALAAELEKIRDERRALQAKKEEEDLIYANPLTARRKTALKRRWDDDVVFRNQTAKAPVREKRFVNDTTRSDKHKAFLKKVVQ